jgi:hypothetical protein
VFDLRRERLVPGVVAPAAARLAAVYHTAAHDVLAPLVGEISPPPRPHARSFRDRVHSPFGRLVARLLIKLLIITPLPREMQLLAALYPVSILWAVVPTEPPDSVHPIQTDLSRASAWPGVSCFGSADRSRAVLILFGTAYSKFGAVDPNGLNGVRVAALGNMTFIKSVKEDPVILAFDRKSIEPQRIKYRAIFPRDEIRKAEIEILKADAANPEGVVAKREPVTIGEDGTGEYTLRDGFEHTLGKIVKARLAINRDISDAEQPPMTERVLHGDRFELGHDEAFAMAADEEVVLSAVNEAIQARFNRENQDEVPYEPPVLVWRTGRDTGGYMQPLAEKPRFAFSASLFNPSDQAVFQPSLYTENDVLLARSEPITVLPGMAKEIKKVEASPTQVPADGKSEITIVAGPIIDALVTGNLVPDGTRVLWTIESETGGGAFEAQETQTIGGSATAKFRAGIDPGAKTLRITVGDATNTVEIQQARLKPKVEVLSREADRYTFTLTVESDAGPPKDNTEVVWGTEYGVVIWRKQNEEGKDFLVGGKSEAEWTELRLPAREVPGNRSHIFAQVGRSRHGAVFDLPRVYNQAGPKATLDNYRLTADDPTGAPEGSATETMGQLTGGAPGQTIPLSLGSIRRPNVQPVAVYQLDDLQAGATENTTLDAYNGVPAVVGDGVEFVAEGSATGLGSARFSGVGSLAIATAPFLGLASDFGISGYVRLQSLDAGQKLVEKAGSYGIQTTIVDGAVRLELYVFSGGERKRALSAEALAASTWYRFHAHFRAGRLRIAVGDDNNWVDAGDTSGPADSTMAPLTLGSALVGDLDEIQIYDLTRPPLFVFVGSGQPVSSGTPTTSVTFDEQGTAEFRLASTGQLLSPGPNAPSGGIAPQMQPVSFGMSIAVEPPRYSEDFLDHVWPSLKQASKDCVEGIGSGENQEWSGVGCDISVSILPVLEIPLAARDAVVGVGGFIYGKEDVSYIAATIGLLTLLGKVVSKRIPIVGPAVTRWLKVVGHAARPPWLRKQLITIGLRAAPDVVAGSVRALDTPTLRILGGEFGDDAAKALDDVFRAVPEARGPAFLKSLDEVAAGYPNKEFAEAIGRVASNPRFGSVIAMQVVETLIELKRAGFVFHFTPEAMEGMAVYASRMSNAPMKAGLIFEAVRWGGGSQVRQAEVMLNFFTWTKQADDAFRAANNPALLEGWHKYLSQIGNGSAGSTAAIDFLVNNTKGYYHTLEYMATKLKFKNIVGIEVRETVNGVARVIDVKVRKTVMIRGIARELIVNIELKNVLPGRKLPRGAKEVPLDVALMLQRAGYDPKGPLTREIEEALIEQLHTAEWVFRGDAQIAATAIAELRSRFENAWPKKARHLLAQFPLQIDFSGFTLPF